MITIISMVFGILGSLLPSLIRLLEKKMEFQYEIKLTELKIEAATKGLEMAVQVEDLKSLVQEGSNLRDHDMYIDGGQFINTLRASVRPVITYTFFIFFIVIKCLAFLVMINQGLPAKEAILTIWDVYTVSLFSTILAFWFGARALSKFEEMYGNKSSITLKK